MKPSCLLVRNAINKRANALQNALQSVTSLWFASEEEAVKYVHERDFDIIVVEGDSVNDLTRFVQSLELNYEHKEQIIVAFQSLSWRKARDALKAGASDCIATTTAAEHILQPLKRIKEAPESQ